MVIERGCRLGVAELAIFSVLTLHSQLSRLVQDCRVTESRRTTAGGSINLDGALQPV